MYSFTIFRLLVSLRQSCVKTFEYGWTFLTGYSNFRTVFQQFFVYFSFGLVPRCFKMVADELISFTLFVTAAMQQFASAGI